MLGQAPSTPYGQSIRNPRARGYGPHKDWLFRRFEKTIPLGRVVVISFRDFLRTEIRQIHGRPYKSLPHMLYVQLADRQLLAIPKALVTNIEGTQDMPSEKQPLVTNDPKFAAFADAVKTAAYVRIEYLQELPADPAITDEKLNTRGLPTTVEGFANELNDDWLVISVGTQDQAADELAKGEPDSRLMKAAIPTSRILDIKILGPSPIDPDAPAVA